VCDETTDACAVQGRDKDGDNARSKACKQNVGTDCDDSRANVSPGAQEVCDGLDNDCDNLADLADGLGLAGSNESIGASTDVRVRPSIAWSREARAYGVTWLVQRPNDALNNLGPYFQTFDQKGTTQVNVRQLLGDSYYPRGATIAWGGDRFGVAYVDNDGIHFLHVGADGKLQPQAWPTIPAVGSNVQSIAVARPGTSDWGLVYTSCFRGCGVTARTLSLSGTLGESHGLSTAGGGGLVARTGGFVMTYSLDSVARAELRDKTLAPPTSADASLSLPGTVPTLGAGPDGFAVAVSRSGLNPALSIFASNGAVVCNSVAFGDTSFEPRAVAGSKDGFIVLSYDNVRIQHISTDCVVSPIMNLDVQAPWTAVHAAGGEDGYAVVWDTGDGQVMRRLFGPRLCD
jgi:hypothetical protein